MSWSSDLSERVVFDIEFSGVILNQMACKFDVILYHTETAEMLLKKGCLDKR